MGRRLLADAARLPTNPVVTGMVTEWGPATVRDPTGAMLIAAVGIAAVVAARSRAPAQVPEQLVRMALLAALAVALAVVLPPVSRAIVPDAASRPELTAAPSAAAGWLAGGEPAARPDIQLPAVGLLPGVPAGSKDPAGGRLPHRAPPGRSAGASTWPSRPDAGMPSGDWQVGIDYVVTGERRTPSLTALLAASGRWRLAFSHGDERVYVRVAPRPMARLPPRAH